MLEKDPGPCQASFYRWYFNSETGLCEEFAYGGCLGNENRFISKTECEETCDRLLVKKPIGRECVSCSMHLQWRSMVTAWRDQYFFSTGGRGREQITSVEYDNKEN